ncbi:hypothetical protein CEXT_80941 [Caerostris extrusa]|uniref:Uncharacterized protein n=1 Tax=Caerostris extrusa TaxID=172846 RepID=A0AAV4M349_CAEEX|nr:hypothetical protein CEXT_80941 [Caerostris extrusa]
MLSLAYIFNKTECILSRILCPVKTSRPQKLKTSFNPEVQIKAPLLGWDGRVGRSKSQTILSSHPSLPPRRCKRSQVKYACEQNRSLANTPQLSRRREKKVGRKKKNKTKKMMQRVGNRWDGGKIGVRVGRK